MSPLLTSKLQKSTLTNSKGLSAVMGHNSALGATPFLFKQLEQLDR